MVGIDEPANRRLAQSQAPGEVTPGDTLLAHGQIECDFGGYHRWNRDDILTIRHGPWTRYVPLLLNIARQSTGQGILCHRCGFRPIVSAGKSFRHIGKGDGKSTVFFRRKDAGVRVSHSEILLPDA